ncbi:MAG TPA: sensor histidine kinase [Epulopiscium sp.]|nr:sensor histidine kinase [Candidatus Epulonipiscium sp.]
MDTKSKSIKYSLGIKSVAVIILWVSLIVSLSSGLFLLFNEDIILAERYEDTLDYKQTISRLAHNTVELGARFKHGNEDFLDKERFKTIEYNLSHAVNYNYYMKDLRTGKVSSKGPFSLQDFKNDPNGIYIKEDEVPYYLYDNSDMEWMLKNTPQEIYISLSNPLEPGDEFYNTVTLFNRVKTGMPYAMGAFGGSILLVVASLFYLMVVSGRKEKDGEVYLGNIDKIYNDVQSLFLLGVAGVSIELASGIGIYYERYNPRMMILMIIIAIDIGIGMTYFFSMLRQFKKGGLLKNTLLYKIVYKFFSRGIKIIKGLFNEKVFNIWLIGLMLVYALVNGILFSFATSGRGRFAFGSLLIIGFNLGAAYFVFNQLKSLTLIMNGAKEISNGNLDYEIDQSEMSMEFESFAKNIQSIQGGLKKAVSTAIKGERMKTDLITNVSHDLKTPLTSIINYVDLLKQEEINNETATGYLEILDEKSYRLKQLIEDLIEASKASSGSLVVITEQVDLHELIIQACGEYEEKIGKAQLDIRISVPEEKTVILADGKYMWRIVENIMSNALKYSMANSRIYIDIANNNGYGILTMKNMSAYPLDIDPAQLTERFTRADESRTTEGSGLGLSIAQSLTTIQGGKFNVEIDGDLFKVIIAMPLNE